MNVVCSAPSNITVLRTWRAVIICICYKYYGALHLELCWCDQACRLFIQSISIPSIEYNLVIWDHGCISSGSAAQYL